MSIPRLHVVTDDGVLGSDQFETVACTLLSAHGAALALHLRGHATPSRRLLSLADSLLPRARARGALLLVNDRLDVALAAGADGVHLGRRSIPPADARSLVGDRLIGCSVHTADGAAAVARWTDFLFLGTIYPTPSHPGEPGAGPRLVTAAAARTSVPVLAIGGVTPDRIAGLVAAGAHGAAVLRGVWHADDPVTAANLYLTQIERGRLDEVGGEQRTRNGS